MLVANSLITLFQDGGPMMWALLICSLVGLFYMIERAIAYTRIKGETGDIFARIRESLLGGDLRESVDVCEEYDHPVATTLKSGLLRYGKSHEEIEKAMESVALHEVSKLERGLWVLLTVANLAPLLGFLGTVLGMIAAFSALSEHGMGNPQAVGQGISQALITTATGLAIALPVQAAYNYYNNRVSNYSLDMETSTSMLLETFSELESKGTRAV